MFPDHCGDDDPKCNKFSFYAASASETQCLALRSGVAWLPNLQHRGPLTDSDDGKAWNSESEYGAAASGASGTVCYSAGSDRRSLLYKLCQHNVSQGPFGERERSLKNSTPLSFKVLELR